jgi:hypothetical protein
MINTLRMLRMQCNVFDAGDACDAGVDSAPAAVQHTTAKLGYAGRACVPQCARVSGVSFFWCTCTGVRSIVSCQWFFLLMSFQQCLFNRVLSTESVQ